MKGIELCWLAVCSFKTSAEMLKETTGKRGPHVQISITQKGETIGIGEEKKGGKTMNLRTPIDLRPVSEVADQ